MRAKQRLIWVTSYPMPPQFDGGFRNAPNAAVGDAYIVPQLQKLGVEIINVLSVIKPRIAESADDHHWGIEPTYEGEYPLTYGVGQVGAELARIITRQICPTQATSHPSPGVGNNNKPSG